MATINENAIVQIDTLNEYSSINFSCPVCKVKKSLKLPKSVINEARQLTTVSIPRGLVCDHHFQAFVDKNFIVRGYQKVDFEIAYDLLKDNVNESPKGNDSDLFNELITEENYVEYNPNQIPENKDLQNDVVKLMLVREEIVIDPLKKDSISIENVSNSKQNTKMSLKEVYDEFWQYITDENPAFQELIKFDERRKKKL
jgi:hypothetical protein